MFGAILKLPDYLGIVYRPQAMRYYRSVWYWEAVIQETYTYIPVDRLYNGKWPEYLKVHTLPNT